MKVVNNDNQIINVTEKAFEILYKDRGFKKVESVDENKKEDEGKAVKSEKSTKKSTAKKSKSTTKKSSSSKKKVKSDD